MPTNYLIIDGNSLGHYSNNGAKLSVGSTEVQAIYYFLKNLQRVCGLYQHYRPVVLWDGASWRKRLLETYKDNRDRKETKNEILLAKAKDSYKLQVPHIKRALRLLGVPQVWSVNMEADDLAAILTDRYAKDGKVILYTGDKDWLQLVAPGVTWRDFANKRTVTPNNFEEMTGVKTPREFIEVKALCGDTGDNVPGVGGIGEKGAIDFIKAYGSFDAFVNMVVLEKSIDHSKLPKKLRDLIDDEKKALDFSRNLKLMDLRTPARPKPENLEVDLGTPSQASFAKFCEILLFQSILSQLDDWIRVFPPFKLMEEAA